jgi:hypothetical protein
MTKPFLFSALRLPRIAIAAIAVLAMISASCQSTEEDAHAQNTDEAAIKTIDNNLDHNEYALLDPDILLALDAEGLKAAIGDDPSEWITSIRQTPMLSATAAWSCICARILQLGAPEILHEWFGLLAGGPESIPDQWLIIDTSEPNRPPHYQNALEYGTAVSGCLLALDDLAQRDSDAAATALQELHTATGIPRWSDENLPALGEDRLFELFLPEALARNSSIYAAYALEQSSLPEQVKCQTAVRQRW